DQILEAVGRSSRLGAWRFRDPLAEIAKQRQEATLLVRLGAVVSRPSLLVGRTDRHTLGNFERPGNGHRAVRSLFASLDELHGEHVLTLDALVAVVRTRAGRMLGVQVDLVLGPVRRL